MLTLQGLAGVYEQVFLPLHGAHQAENAACALAAVEAFFGAGAEPGRSTSRSCGPRSPRCARRAGSSRSARRRPILVDAAHNPAGMAATVTALGEAFDFRRLVAVVAMLADKDVRGMLARARAGGRRDRGHPELLGPRARRRRPRRSSRSRSSAPTGSASKPRLDDAIETAVRLAEETGDDILSGTGVLVTGSVVTAGEARTLLGAGT